MKGKDGDNGGRERRRDGKLEETRERTGEGRGRKMRRKGQRIEDKDKD